MKEIVLYFLLWPGPSRGTLPWCERNSSLLFTVTRPEQGNITLVRKKQFVTFNHRRRIELEDKAEGHRACLGDRIIAAPAVLPSAGQIDQLSSTVFGAKQLARQWFCPPNRRDDLLPCLLIQSFFYAFYCDPVCVGEHYPWPMRNGTEKKKVT